MADQQGQEREITTPFSPEKTAGIAVLAMIGAAVAVKAIAQARRKFAVHQANTVAKQEARVRPTGPCPGDILLFYRPARRRDFVIRLVTRSPFYHAALYDSGDGNSDDLDGGGYVIEARPNGVHRNSLAGRERNYVVVGSPGEKGAQALAWAKTQIGAGYDRKDMGVILLEHLFTRWHINYVPHGAYTCAEFVATAYQNAGVALVPGEELSSVDPGDIGVRWVPDETVRGL